MKVFVVGANGQIGKQLVQLLHESKEHTVRAMVRAEDQAEAYKQAGIETVVADLEGSVPDLVTAAKGCEAIVFAAGSGGHTGADKTLLVDLEGASRTIEAAQQLSVKQFVMVSAINANKRDNWTRIQHYMVAKHHADRLLQESGIPYTIVRPGGLLNEPATGKISMGNDLERSTIPRADVAAVLYEVLGKERLYNKAFDIVSGEETIAEAIDQFK
ncbi:MAG TPA: SDR family oxidoreductase [Pseudogracilibacillus sp.]|nr:SDR family oxidoreductase [Pseudogracilibacillus sp.]